MTDKVRKIREEVERLQKRAEHNLDTSLTENERQFWLGESNVLTLIGKYIDTMQGEQIDYGKLQTSLDDALSKETKESWDKFLQEKPASIDFEQELYKAFGQVKDFTLGMRIAKRFYEMGRNHQEPVSEDLPHIRHRDTLDEFAYQCAYDLSNDWAKETPEWRDVKTACKLGAQWQKEHLWKAADGDDLPEYDREVIAILDYDFGHYKVVYAHRPNPNGWDGKNIDTNEVTHYTPKLYDKGGWNAPNIVYWLDARLPYEENKIIKEL